MTNQERSRRTRARRKHRQVCIDCAVPLDGPTPLRCFPCRLQQSAYMARYYQRTRKSGVTGIRRRRTLEAA
jgi:hypothetical protein